MQITTPIKFHLMSQAERFMIEQVVLVIPLAGLIFMPLLNGSPKMSRKSSTCFFMKA